MEFFQDTYCESYWINIESIFSHHGGKNVEFFVAFTEMVRLLRLRQLIMSLCPTMEPKIFWSHTSIFKSLQFQKIFPDILVFVTYKSLFTFLFVFKYNFIITFVSLCVIKPTSFLSIYVKFSYLLHIFLWDSDISCVWVSSQNPSPWNTIWLNSYLLSSTYCTAHVIIDYSFFEIH